MGMGTEWPPTPAQQRKAVVSAGSALKLVLFVILAGLALRLLVGPPAYLLPPTAAPEGAARLFAVPERERTAGGGGGGIPSVETDDAVFTLTDSEPLTALGKKEGSTKPEESCDLFHGEWVPNSSGPAYTNASCRFIESPQNCMTNGRPDTDYLNWRWKPYGCEVSPFDGKKFLDGMKGKHWALIGDSILRNHVQSLLCLLSKVEDATEVYHDDTFRSRRWHFPSYNFTISLVWAPFLVKAKIFEDDDGVSTADLQLHLDVLETDWTSQWEKFDYAVISTGQWFFKTAVYWENGAAIGCHSCQNKTLEERPPEYSFRRALRVAFQFITSSPHKPVVFYRTWAPSHFENGEWFSGGTCNRTAPFKPGEAGDREWDNSMWRIEREEFHNAVPIGGDRLKLLDTFELSLLRPDGHPGPYRAYHPYEKGVTAKVQNDCLHWCLPGPIDAWNDVIMKMVAKD
ncbi:Protein trichome birefringence-like 25 [Zea mays]|uniref:Protein trichome birefringence-like 26 n=3 Tax=Zea mays TaxID=4577 RepID=B4FPK0_MAIZE|nr:putative DUF231 domain containing family protein [Zea mays]ACF84043.1 unknown [Zea mays]ACR35727.1 unknown [Zea mays]AQL03704.1 Protein trichome birefringence-like 26 [Zea mays]PWZ05137.1 Protein trichome birefringence-like 25 [Zea mays]|eukprot:NP_001140539.1 putative DUF231 domain containing family protein [Zea mays]